MINIELFNHYKDSKIDSYFYKHLLKPLKKHVLELNNFNNIELSVMISDNAYIKKMNHQFRNINKDTNILSFSTDIVEESLTAKYIGDIIISEEKILTEALSQNKSFVNHLSHIFIHGFLHLLGYNHINSDDAIKMESLEIKVLAEVDIKNPYED